MDEQQAQLTIDQKIRLLELAGQRGIDPLCDIEQTYNDLKKLILNDHSEEGCA